MIIHDKVQLDFGDVLIAPQNTSANHRGDIDIVRDFKRLGLKGVPVMSANMTQMGNFKTAKVLLDEGCFATLHKFYTANDIIVWLNKEFDGKIPANLFFTIGLRNKDDEIHKLKDIRFFIDDKTEWHAHDGSGMNILIDVPNAYIPDVEQYVKEVRKEFPKSVLAVGNVTSGDITQRLIRAGADIVKVGIGPSQICDTRIKTGCGRPQLSAIIECAEAAHKADGYIIADGGFKNPADICKALIAGADFCMSGSFFAGTDEANGEIITKYKTTNELKPVKSIDSHTGPFVRYDPVIIEEKFKEYYGMSSFRAQQENYGVKTKTGTSEGVECKLVPYVGSTKKVIDDIKGSIRSCGSYIGALKIKNFMRQGVFYKVNRIK